MVYVVSCLISEELISAGSGKARVVSPVLPGCKRKVAKTRLAACKGETGMCSKIPHMELGLR